MAYVDGRICPIPEPRGWQMTRWRVNGKTNTRNKLTTVVYQVSVGRKEKRDRHINSTSTSPPTSLRPCAQVQSPCWGSILFPIHNGNSPGNPMWHRLRLCAKPKRGASCPAAAEQSEGTVTERKKKHTASPTVCPRRNNELRRAGGSIVRPFPERKKFGSGWANK